MSFPNPRLSILNPNLQALRQQLREKFPAAHQQQAPESSLPLTTSLPSFPSGALTELTPIGPASGLSLVLAELLKSQDEDQCQPNKIALIDGRDSFDPASYDPASCSRLLWIRCHDAEESLRCSDLLLHDGNLPLLVLDLQLNPLAELHNIPTSSWYRLRNLAKQTGVSLLIFTPKHLIPCAALQLTFNTSFSLRDLERNRDELTITPTRELTAARSS